MPCPCAFLRAGCSFAQAVPPLTVVSFLSWVIVWKNWASPEFCVVLTSFVTFKNTADGLGPSPGVVSKGAKINIKLFLKGGGGWLALYNSRVSWKKTENGFQMPVFAVHAALRKLVLWLVDSFEAVRALLAVASVQVELVMTLYLTMLFQTSELWIGKKTTDKSVPNSCTACC